MKGKNVKLIIGVILLAAAIVLYLLKALDPNLCLALAILGAIFIVLAFTKKKGNLPAVAEKPGVPVESAEEKNEPVEVESNADEQNPLS